MRAVRLGRASRVLLVVIAFAAVFLNLVPGHAPPTLGTVAAKLDLQQALLDAKLIYRPPQIATASNGTPISMIRFKW